MIFALAFMLLPFQEKDFFAKADSDNKEVKYYSRATIEESFRQSIDK